MSRERRPIPEAPVSRETRRRLDRFRDLLLAWRERINLIAERDAAAVEQRHIADSLQLLPLLPAQGAVADLGSGAGFPGLVLAIATERSVHLIESDRRKAAFLLEASRLLGLPHVHIHAARIEAVPLTGMAAVTARAVAPLRRLLPHAVRLLGPGGVAIFPKGRTAEAELTDAAGDWKMTIERFQSRTEPDATILRLSDIRRAGA
ncbi:16S rRNA (guanine(527)-N(7))-methyltransferase RsmG [Caldovatus aquaticus]|uniref:Ribosomal RNA small subunit methyltransferase G n=1 Tax=Caldovatus aquaticus TaxID=2865671 RepID=A0ABS7F680_9PROT|nr:16S rRNA (guanine(527)-N(7))-methyltransferase RsmG [Caldovatus aquaticus]MBW8270457.1 16S rRNA (guanine(527)-N(7))-methyltransferase RsmG [Caldovatus aquaticus]